MFHYFWKFPLSFKGDQTLSPTLKFGNILCDLDPKVKGQIIYLTYASAKFEVATCTSNNLGEDVFTR